MVKPLNYIEYETLIVILHVIKNLDENLKEKIVEIIASHIAKIEEYNLYTINFHNNDHMHDMYTFDYYWSE